jgi:hypothetical protein
LSTMNLYGVNVKCQKDTKDTAYLFRTIERRPRNIP